MSSTSRPPTPSCCSTTSGTWRRSRTAGGSSETSRNCVDTVFVRVLVGNKDDDDQSRKAVASYHGADFAKSIGYEFIETSAKDNRNVEQLFRRVAELCLERRRREEDSA
ncbi:hypothetical protein BV898_08730 [Hypsibius exemplaris]|uniref:Uncharacterized protein n=1 Tax=Hypsibius exemplaris TaxID=2072580 RepID=A0A1W0WPL6_HYPEX|nr:hypothetical protein BV898_08730 [Hypsibius exemplaris]